MRLFSLLVFSLLCLAACMPSKEANDLWHNYQQRLAKVIESPIPPGSTTLPHFDVPSTNAPQSKQTVSLLELYKLNQCQLGPLIASRNNSLGKVAPPSQQLIYHIKFLQLVDACLTQFAEKNMLTPILIKAKQAKITDRMQVFNYMLTNDASINQALFIRRNSLQLGKEQQGLLEIELAIKQLLAIKLALQQKQLTKIDSEIIELQLAQFQYDQLLARYMTSLNHSYQALIEINQFLAQHSQKLQCKAGYHQQQQQILNNIFNRFYLGDIQAYIGQLNQIHYRLSESITQLFAGSAYQPQIDYYFADTQASLPQLFKQAIRQHVMWWQSIRESCQLSP